MRLSDLQSKDIVSKDGKRLGRIIDAEINIYDGIITYLIVEPNKTFLRNFVSGKESTISFKQINKVGEDVILVDM